MIHQEYYIIETRCSKVEKRENIFSKKVNKKLTIIYVRMSIKGHFEKHFLETFAH
jgi:hypothetical protein